MKIPETTFADADLKTLSGPGLRAFFRIGERWKLTTDEQMRLLGLEARSTFFKWKKEGAVVSRDTLERISYILGIYKALQILIPNRESADAWVKHPNKAPLFGGRPALDRMLKGVSGLYVVRQYLDGQLSGW
jgi:hypothetical protein